jgi:hypothetical protein
MKTEMVFFDEKRMAHVVFNHVAFAILNSFKQYTGEYMTMALIFNNVDHVDPKEFECKNYDMVEFVQLNGYIRKESDKHVTQQQFCGIALLEHDTDAKCMIVVEIPGNNISYMIKIERRHGDDDTHDTLGAFMSADRLFITNDEELLEEEPVKYYGEIIKKAVGEIVEHQSLARIIDEDGRQVFEYRI